MRNASASVASPVLLSCLVIALVAGIGIGAYAAGKGHQSGQVVATVAAATPTALATPTATAAIPTPDTTASATPAATASTDIASAQAAVNTFMGLMVNAGSSSISSSQLADDQSLVLESFTAPQTAAEQSDFAFISGTDDGSTPAPSNPMYPKARILGGSSGFNYTLAKYGIQNGTEAQGAVTLPVTEMRSSWGGSAYSESEVTTYLDMVQSDGKWMVENYYTKGNSADWAKSTKYDAF